MDDDEVKVVGREEYKRRARDPWRFICPHGHTTISLKSSTRQEKWSYHAGISDVESVHSEHRGVKWTGSFRCKTCESPYAHVYDRKKDEWVAIAEDVKDVDRKLFDPNELEGRREAVRPSKKV